MNRMKKKHLQGTSTTVSLDEVNKLEDLLRPQSVPNEDRPKVPNIKPRRQIQETEALEGGRESTGTATRPKAPMLKSNEETQEGKLGARRRRSKDPSKKGKAYRIEQSLDESLESIQNFGRQNKGRQLRLTGANVSLEESIHFVNIDDDECKEETQEDAAESKGQSSNLAEPVARVHQFVFKEPVDTLNGKIKSISSSKFQIPELPTGQHLVINILSTWGDPFYVGLMGIEIFDKSGHLMEFTDIEKQISADPSDLNVTEAGVANHDPRTIEKILDGYNHTCDELHSWLAPFQRGENHFIYIEFDYPTSISMLRLWNYNATRIHSYRGARYVEMTLDGKFIFKGEIGQAPGCAASVESCSECILFTSNETVLGLIEKYDKYYEISSELTKGEDENENLGHPQKGNEDTPRPSTGDKSLSKLDQALSPLMSIQPEKEIVADNNRLANLSYRPRTAPIRGAQAPVPQYGQKMAFYILSNYGDPFSVGLTGMEILNEHGQPISIPFPAGVSVRGGNVERLFSHTKVTMEENEMWLLPLEKCGPLEPVLTIDLQTPKAMSAFRFWNYNSSVESSFRGAKRIFITCDGQVISPPEGFLIRKAPGNLTFDFAQFIPLPTLASSTRLPLSENRMNTRKPSSGDNSAPSGMISKSGSTSSSSKSSKSWRHNLPAKIEEDSIPQQYETPLFPSGCILKFVFFSTWSDPYYLGLNGIELYDRANELIRLTEDVVEADPRDINVLPEVNGKDGRTLDKLYDGVNNTYDDHHMWLSPYSSARPNVLFLLFDEPIVLSRILLWNYSKTPTRGVRELEIQMDDVIIYHGILNQAPEYRTTSRRSAKASEDVDMTQAVLFTNDPEVLDAERHHVYIPEETQDQVMFIDNDQIWMSSSSQENKQHSVRPTTSTGYHQ